MDTRNRMMTHAPMTMPMDLLGLRKRDDTVLRLLDSPSHKETQTMRYISPNETVLTLKDKLAAPKPPDQSQNWEEVRRLLMEAARKIDPTYSISEQEALCARLIADMMRETAPTPRSANEYLRKIADDSNEKFATEQRMRRCGQEVASRLAVPLSKRYKDGFQRIY